MPTTIADDLRERVLSYIAHQVEQGPQRIHREVQKGHEQLTGLIDGLSEAQATFKPSADDWSILELMQHVVAAKRGVAGLCGALARGDQAERLGGEGEEPRQDGLTGPRYATLAVARSACDAAHDELVAFIATPSPETDEEARYPHFIFGRLNCWEWAAFQRIHDADHAGQIEKVKAAPGFPLA